jgi:transposase
MPTERVPMRKIHEILRLKFACGLSKRQIAASTGVGVTTVSDYLRRARRAGVSWPLPVGMSDDLLEARLFVPPSPLPAEPRPVPDWACVHRELRRPDVTLTLLWEEYRAQAPEGYGYSWFCDLYREWAGRLKPTMRQPHVAGDKLFVDFAGRTVDIVAGPTGAVRRAAIFVAVLGASSYTYAEAVWTQALPDWIGAHARTFTYLGGCPRLVVPDNLKSGITKACFYEPQVQRTYADMLRHYGVAPLPARPVKPRDKAKVEVGVQVIQRWILARLRNQVFHSLEQLNTAIRALLDELNDRMMRHLGVTRRQLFEQLDKPALRSLPVEPYVYAEWKRCRVGLDYHIEVDKHLYSVPYTLLRQEVEARVSTTTVEIFHRGKRVATHLRSPGRGPTTVTEHMPSSHRRYKDWTVERIQRDAASIGPASVALVGAILAGKPHPEQGFRAAVGILRLARSYGPERLEAACERALAIGARSYTSVHSILRNNLDRVVTGPAAEAPVLHHANIRGSRYYH